MYIQSNVVYLQMSTVSKVPWHSWLDRQSSKREVLRSSPTVQEFFILLFSLSLNAQQLESAVKTILINRDKHLAYDLLLLENRYLLVKFSFNAGMKRYKQQQTVAIFFF